MNSSGQLSISMQEKNNLGQLSKGLGLRSFALLLFALSLFSYFALCSFPLLLFCSCCSLLKEQGDKSLSLHFREKANSQLVDNWPELFFSWIRIALCKRAKKVICFCRSLQKKQFALIALYKRSEHFAQKN